MNHSAVYQGHNRRVLLINSQTLTVEPFYLIDDRLVQYYGPDTVRFVHDQTVKGYYIETARNEGVGEVISEYMSGYKGLAERQLRHFIGEVHAFRLLADMTEIKNNTAYNVFVNFGHLNGAGGLVRRIKNKQVREDVQAIAYKRHIAQPCFLNSAIGGHALTFHQGGLPRSYFLRIPVDVNPQSPPFAFQPLEEGDFIIVAVRANGEQSEGWEVEGYERGYSFKVGQYQYGAIKSLTYDMSIPLRAKLLKRIVSNTIPKQYLTRIMKEELDEAYLDDYKFDLHVKTRLANKRSLFTAYTPYPETSFPELGRLFHLRAIGLTDNTPIMDEKVDFDESPVVYSNSERITGRKIHFSNGYIVSRLGNIPGYGYFIKALGVTVGFYHNSRNDNLRNSFGKALEQYVTMGEIDARFKVFLNPAIEAFLGFTLERHLLESPDSQWFQDVKVQNYSTIEVEMRHVVN